MSGQMFAGYLCATQVGEWITIDGEDMVLRKVIHDSTIDKTRLVLYAVNSDRRTIVLDVDCRTPVLVETPSMPFTQPNP